MLHSSQMILFVSSSSHPNNTIHEGISAIATRSKALTQHISSSHGTKKGDNLAPLENYMDNTWAPLGETWRPLSKGRVATSKRMNFRKSSKRPFIVHFRKIICFVWGTLHPSLKSTTLKLHGELHEQHFSTWVSLRHQLGITWVSLARNLCVDWVSLGF